MPSDENEDDGKDLEQAISLLRDCGIRLLVFDMDQTAVAVHSHGCLRRDKLDNYLKQATPEFVRAVPALHAAGFALAIATHSDEAEFGGDVQPPTHILGHELATALVQHYFPPEVANSFFIVAYNPRARGTQADEENCVKRYHMRQLQKHFGVQPGEILFFDDNDQVVRDCNDVCGVLTIQVDPKQGFKLSDLFQLEQSS